MARPIIIVGQSYRCGSTLLQRLLNTSGECQIWGEDQNLIVHIDNILREKYYHFNHQDNQMNNFPLQRELVQTGVDGWTAMASPYDINVLIRYYRVLFRELYKDLVNSDKKYWGFQLLSSTDNVLQTAIGLVSNEEKPYVIGVTRCFKEVAQSYYQQKWAYYELSDLLNMWKRFYSIPKERFDYIINYRTLYDEYTINELFDTLEIENRSNIRSVLNNKITYINEEKQELTQEMIMVLENLSLN